MIRSLLLASLCVSAPLFAAPVQYVCQAVIEPPSQIRFEYEIKAVLDYDTELGRLASASDTSLSLTKLFNGNPTDTFLVEQDLDIARLGTQSVSLKYSPAASALSVRLSVSEDGKAVSATVYHSLALDEKVLISETLPCEARSI
jgi:hypothetical protein